ncbi:hypothetical protein Drorol1_Dr00013853 [Drosera rotundifolia]
MEIKGLGGRMFSNMGSGEMLGLDMPLQPPGQPAQNPNQNRDHRLQQPSPTSAQMVGLAHHEPEHNHPLNQLSMKQTYSFMPKSKQQAQQSCVNNSDEDESGYANDDSSVDGKRKVSPWHRMKWTDDMIRLLIMVVYYIGDEVGSEGNEKKKSVGMLQKKGKWKSVSGAMLEKGFCVSPQQCEDKFNDLNKRYKRVIDILGKGTACRVVENHSLLETMDLSPKMKEEARKLLNSKHLFFREMCAYHSSCSHGANNVAGAAVAASSGVQHSPEVAAGIPTTTQENQQCFHAQENQATTHGSHRMAMEETSRIMVKGECGEGEDDVYYDDQEEEDDEEHEDDDHDEADPHVGQRNRTREDVPMPSAISRQFSHEVASVLQDGTKSRLEKKQWLKILLLQIEEQGVKYQYEAFEIEKQRLKWIKFSSKKEREMEKMKLDNERKRLENKRMILLLRQKELELSEQQHAPNVNVLPMTR